MFPAELRPCHQMTVRELVHLRMAEGIVAAAYVRDPSEFAIGAALSHAHAAAEDFLARHYPAAEAAPVAAAEAAASAGEGLPF
jgi:hypothetical protein